MARTLVHQGRLSCPITTTPKSVGDDLKVERLVGDAGSLNDDDLARIKRIALGEISVAGRLVSHDGRVAGLVISFAFPDGNPERCADRGDRPRSRPLEQSQGGIIRISPIT